MSEHFEKSMPPELIDRYIRNIEEEFGQCIDHEEAEAQLRRLRRLMQIVHQSK